MDDKHAINDIYGRKAGDIVLRQVVQMLQHTIREKIF
ncbi:diguanylate cyclase [uncultured Paraglaciecola sp.]